VKLEISTGLPEGIPAEYGEITLDGVVLTDAQLEHAAAAVYAESRGWMIEGSEGSWEVGFWLDGICKIVEGFTLAEAVQKAREATK
jgi:hypothetical protein